MDEPDLQGGDISYRDMVPNVCVAPSVLRELYEDSVVFITGGTGFLGKILIEKLLRSCPYIRKIYVLVRPKKGKTMEERFAEMFKEPVFERLMGEREDPPDNIFPIAGDCGILGLGLSAENRKLLEEQVSVVFHAAATVRFDEKLDHAVNTNVRGVREMLALCKSMRQFKVLVHISTAFSHCPKMFIEEKFYPTPIEPEKLIDLVQGMKPETVEMMTPSIIHPWPNTYAYTKAVAEELLRTMGNRMAIAIIRPSIVIATAREPLAGWIDNLYGATGVVIAAAAGLLRTLHCDPKAVADLVPADLVVNAAIVGAYDVAKEKSLNDNVENPEIVETEPKIYNYVSCTQKPITWGEFMDLTLFFGTAVPLMVTLWYPDFALTKYKIWHQLKVLFLHMVPAHIVDTIAKILGRPPLLVNGYRKVNKFADVISYFCTQQWRFTNTNTRRLTEMLSMEDRKEFDCDMARITWTDYFYTYVRGMRVYLRRDGLETVPAAQKRFRRLQIAHYLLVSSTWGLVFFLSYKLYQCIF